MELLGSHSYALAKFIFQRGLGFCYLLAFVVVVRQYLPLYGSDGLLPLKERLDDPQRETPLSFFTYFSGDWVLRAGAFVGIALSVIATVGISDAYGTPVSVAVWATLWLLFLSFYNAGTTFFDYTYDSLLLLELGFLAVFLGGTGTATPDLIVWLSRWTLGRLMLGSGLAKLAGDVDWRTLDALSSFFETVPFPNPLSWYLHHLPTPLLRTATGLTLLLELVLPVLYFFPQPWATAAGVITILFQLCLICSANLASINVLTTVLAVFTINDTTLRSLLGTTIQTTPLSDVHQLVVWVVFVVVIALSYYPVKKMLFNPTGFVRYDSLPIVNTYCMYYTVASTRYEIVLEGTNDNLDADPTWKEYAFTEIPHDPASRPSQIAPYNYKLEFRLQTESGGGAPSPWFQRCIQRLLTGDEQIASLLQTNPFPSDPPRYIRAIEYEYRFTHPSERAATGEWWVRSNPTIYYPPVTLKDLPDDRCVSKQSSPPTFGN
jgi:hypothetical protein